MTAFLWSYQILWVFTQIFSSLSHHSLIKNTGIVTRCPLELKMTRKKKGEAWYGKISYRDYNEELKKPSLVEKKIREGTAWSILKCHCYWWRQKIGQLNLLFRCDSNQILFSAQDKLVGNGTGISNDLISLEIASPDVPDLTLIDLPGITRVAVSGQSEDIGEQVAFGGRMHQVRLKYSSIHPCHMFAVLLLIFRKARKTPS